jgi:hypothetical protein
VLPSRPQLAICGTLCPAESTLLPTSTSPTSPTSTLSSLPWSPPRILPRRGAERRAPFDVGSGALRQDQHLFLDRLSALACSLSVSGSWAVYKDPAALAASRTAALVRESRPVFCIGRHCACFAGGVAPPSCQDIASLLRYPRAVHIPPQGPFFLAPRPLRSQVSASQVWAPGPLGRGAASVFPYPA